MTGDRIVDPAARLAYEGDALDDEGMPGAPLEVLSRWYADAKADHRVVEPGAMVVATVDAEGRPDARTVLLKGLDARGLSFYTNLASVKARQLDGSPYASLVLLWHPMYRQVRVRGAVVRIDEQEAAAYFATRPRGSQIAARASHQSDPVAARADLEADVAREAARWPDTGSPYDVPLPSWWGGFLVVPDEVELWVGRASRLHDRLAYRRVGPGALDDPAAWRVERLQP